MRIILPVILSASLSGLIIWLFVKLYQHEQKYKCLSGHDEVEVQFDPALNMATTRVVFVCDCEVLRTEYNKDPKKYENCNCN